MSFLSCKNGPSGGTMSETELWSNSSPTSSFAVQTITLDISYSNFDYIKMYCRHSTSDSTEFSAIVPTANLVLCSESGFSAMNTGQTLTVGCSEATSSTSKEYGRQVGKVDGDSTYKKMRVSACNSITGGTGRTINELLIPTKIVGIK